MRHILAVRRYCYPLWMFWRGFWPALCLVMVFVSVGVASLVTLIFHGNMAQWLGYADSVFLWRIIRFSVWQAFLSASLSLLIAVPVASALFHRRFVGRNALLQLFSVSLVVPTIVAILGIVMIYGRRGWLSSFLGIELPLYGLTGILLAHVFFNMPFAVRLLLQSYRLIPSGQWRLAYQLGFSRWHAFRLVEWAYVRRALPGIFVLIFLLCFTSFAVVLSLGGGPRASTLEVAIYQALRFEFDIPKATFLALLQVFICSSFAWLIYRLAATSRQDFSLTPIQSVPLPCSAWATIMDSLFLCVAILLVLPPFLAILSPIMSPVFWQTMLLDVTWQAVTVSLKIAVPAATLALIFGWSFAVLARYSARIASFEWVAIRLEQLGNSILMLPALVLATGLFLLLRQLGIGLDAGYWIVVWVNAVMALPFVLRVLLPTLYQLDRRYRLLYQSLGVSGWWRLRLEWPLIRHSVAQALAYALLLCLGDMGVIALFGSDGLVSLPLLLFQLMGSYRLDQGGAIAVLLVLVCLLLFILVTRVVGGRTYVNN